MERDPFDLLGDVLDGQFRVVEVAGEGSLSIVYKGHHQGVDAPVAIKCLNLPATLDAALVGPLVESFREASKLHYRLARGNLNIAQAIASGSTMAPRTGAVVPYLVREWFEGQSLAADLEHRRASGGKGRTVDEAVALFEPAFDAVAHAHAEGVVHSALNPSNFFLARRGEESSLKVLDFGVARTMNQIASKLPSEPPPRAEEPAGLHLLFPTYAAPEQLDKRVGDVGPWTDVYTLALVLLEALSDRAVMAGSEIPALVERVLDERRRPTPRAHGLELPRSLELALTRAVSRAPERRQKNAAELWSEIQASRRGGSSRSVAPASTGSLRPKAPTLAGIAPAPAVAGAVPGRRLVLNGGSGVGTVPMSFEPAAAGTPGPARASSPPVAPSPPKSMTLRAPAAPPGLPPPPQLAPPTPPPPPVEPSALPPVIVAEPTPPLPLSSYPPASAVDAAAVDALLSQVSTRPPPPPPADVPAPAPVLAPDRPAWPTGPQAPTYPILEPTPEPRPRRRGAMWIGLAAVVAVVLVALTVGGVAWKRRSASAARPGSPTASPPSAPSASVASVSGAASGALPGADPAAAAPPPAAESAPAAATPAAATPAASAPPAAHFEAHAGKRALDKTWHELAHCRRGKVWGSGSAMVTFANDGTVSHVVLTAPFAGSATGACVGGALGTAQAAPFGGKPGVLFYRFYVPPR